MKHIAVFKKKARKKGEDHFEAACGEEVPLGTMSQFDGEKVTYEGPINEFVEAALESDCDSCRTKVGVGRVNDSTWEGKKLGVKEHSKWEPQPMADAAQILEHVFNRRV